MMTAMLAGDPLVQKDGILFVDGINRLFLYGQMLPDEQRYTVITLLNADIIASMPPAPSPAIVQFRVTEFGFEVAKELRKLRAKFFAEAVKEAA